MIVKFIKNFCFVLQYSVLWPPLNKSNEVYKSEVLFFRSWRGHQREEFPSLAPEILPSKGVLGGCRIARTHNQSPTRKWSMLQGSAWSFACIAIICRGKYSLVLFLPSPPLHVVPLSFYLLSLAPSHTSPNIQVLASPSPVPLEHLFCFLSHALHYLSFTLHTAFSALLSDPATSSQPLAVHAAVTRSPSPIIVSTSVTSFRYSCAHLII